MKKEVLADDRSNHRMEYYLCTKTQEQSFKFPLPSECSLTKMLGGNASTMNDNASTAKAVPPADHVIFKRKGAWTLQ